MTETRKSVYAALFVGALALTGCFAAAPQDFFECGPSNTLVVCPVGETPDPAVHGDCRNVGDGDTTIDSGTCL